MTQQGRNMLECVTIDDKTLIVYLLVISVLEVRLFHVVIYDVREICTAEIGPKGHVTSGANLNISASSFLGIPNYPVLCKNFNKEPVLSSMLYIFRELPSPRALKSD
jgi:hypothetical protein